MNNTTDPTLSLDAHFDEASNSIYLTSKMPLASELSAMLALIFEKGKGICLLDRIMPIEYYPFEPVDLKIPLDGIESSKTPEQLALITSKGRINIPILS